MTPDALPALPPIVAARLSSTTPSSPPGRIAAEAPRQGGGRRPRRGAPLRLPRPLVARRRARLRRRGHQAVGVLGGVLATLQHPPPTTRRRRRVRSPPARCASWWARRSPCSTRGPTSRAPTSGAQVPRDPGAPRAPRPATRGAPASVPLPRCPPRGGRAQRRTSRRRRDRPRAAPRGGGPPSTLDALDAPGAADDGGRRDDEPPARGTRAPSGRPSASASPRWTCSSERARGCLEDLGAFGRQRRPMDDGAGGRRAPGPAARARRRARGLRRRRAPWLVRLLESGPCPTPSTPGRR